MSLRKKVLVSMLAAGLVFASVPFVGPFSTYSGSTVSAAGLSSYAGALSGAFAQLNPTEKGHINTVKNAINGIDNAGWQAILNDIPSDNDDLYSNLLDAFPGADAEAKRDAIRECLADFFSLAYLDSSDLSSKLDEFKTKYTNEFKNLFGSDFTFDELTDLFDDIADEAIKEIVGLVLDDSSTIDDIDQAMVDAIKAGAAKNPDFNNKLNAIGTSIDDFLGIKSRLEARIGANNVNAAQTASFGAIARANSTINVGSSVVNGQSYSLAYTISLLGLETTLTRGLNWTVSSVSPSGIASVSGSTLSVTGTGSFVLEATKGGIVVARKSITAVNPGSGSTGGDASTTPPAQPTAPITTDKVVPVVETVQTSAAGQTTNTVSAKAEDVLKQAQDSKEAANLVLKASKDADVVTAALPSDLVNKLNVSNPNHAVSLQTPAGTVSLPVAALSQVLANAAGQGIDAVNAQVNLVVEKVSEADRKALEEQLGADSQTLSGLVQTKIVITSGDKTYEVKVYTDYVTNTVIIDGIHNANQLVGVSYSGSQGTASKVQTFAVAATSVGQASALPTIVKHENGKTVVTMMTRTNAPFTVVKTNKKFSDVSNQWFAADVTLLANKLLINGVTEGVYAPNNTLTRAEFATMLVRALGLPEDVDAGVEFSDVMVTDWFAGYVGAASSAGIIQGKGDGKFDPKGSVTRQEVAKMVVAAVEFASKKSVTANSAALAKFSDADQVSSWALDAVKFAAEKEILKGSGGKLNPKSTATRAEAAAFIKRFLNEVGFISE